MDKKETNHFKTVDIEFTIERSVQVSHVVISTAMLQCWF